MSLTGFNKRRREAAAKVADKAPSAPVEAEKPDAAADVAPTEEKADKPKRGRPKGGGKARA